MVGRDSMEYITQDTYNNYSSEDEELEVLKEGCVLEAKAERAVLLLKCDWTQGADSPLTDAKRNEWQVYRQALRNITSTEGWPLTHEWPTKPL